MLPYGNIIVVSRQKSTKCYRTGIFITRVVWSDRNVTVREDLSFQIDFHRGSQPGCAARAAGRYSPSVLSYPEVTGRTSCLWLPQPRAALGCPTPTVLFRATGSNAGSHSARNTRPSGWVCFLLQAWQTFRSCLSGEGGAVYLPPGLIQAARRARRNRIIGFWSKLPFKPQASATFVCCVSPDKRKPRPRLRGGALFFCDHRR